MYLCISFDESDHCFGADTLWMYSTNILAPHPVDSLAPIEVPAMSTCAQLTPYSTKDFRKAAA